MILKTALSSGEAVPVLILNTLGGYVLFKCECDAQFFLRETNSFEGWHTIKCTDCKRRERVLDHVGERYVLKRVRSDAVRGGRQFNLTLEWMINNIHKPCHYCGRRNTNRITVKSKVPGEVLIENFRYNGIDRVDNDGGYTPFNCVPCCFVCNRAKQSMEYDDFLAWIDSVIEYRGNTN